MPIQGLLPSLPLPEDTDRTRELKLAAETEASGWLGRKLTPSRWGSVAMGAMIEDKKGEMEEDVLTYGNMVIKVKDKKAPMAL